MNKQLLLLAFCLFAGLNLIAQYDNVDFEPAGAGASWNWIISENGSNPPLEFLANPVSGGINATPTVAKFTAEVAGQSYALTFTDDIEEFTFDATNTTIKIMVYKSVISNVAIKFEGCSAPIEINIPNTVTDQWEEITYDFSSVIGNTYGRIIIIPDFIARTQENIVYFDNIQIPTGSSDPVVAAPTPIHGEVAYDVISIFSDSYTDVSTDYNPNWGQQTQVSFPSIAGDNTMKYACLNYQGADFSGNPVDAASHDFLHIDFWSSNSTVLNFFLISWNPTVETPFSLTIVPDQWNSVDIPLSAFAPVDLSTIRQFKVEGNGTVWWDNIYFYKSEPLPIELISFDAEAQDGKVQISWATSSELNNNYFEIEKSRNGKDFEVLDMVQASISPNIINRYTAVDNTPNEGLNYYRLTQVDHDGSSTKSEIVTVQFDSNQLELVRKQVSGDVIELSYNIPSHGDYEIQAYTIDGQLLYSKEMTLTKGINDISFELIQSGIIITRINNNSVQFVEKIFK